MAPRISVDQESMAQLCRRHGICKLALFGSVLRDDFGPTSDIDVLVEFEPGRVPGFFGLHHIECEIAALFGDHKVDLLTFRSLNRHLKDRILSEAEVQYAA
jgi:predicted nucleotidyltransferase